MLWFGLALAAPTVEADFDGDGKPEKVAPVDDKLPLKGAPEVFCEMDMCDLEVLDVDAGKPGKELVVCEHGPRDDVSCRVFVAKAGSWSEIPFPKGAAPSNLSSSGNGILLGYHVDRWYPRLEKYTVGPAGFVRAPQPFYSTANERRPEGLSYTPTRIFPIVDRPGGSAVVANVATGRTVYVLLESAEHLANAGYDDGKRWFLVRTTSGLVGWATLQTIIASSDELMMLNAAG